MSTKHTPAPWAVWNMGRNLTVTATGNESKKHPNEGMHIATIHRPESTTHDELFTANARLIAAAPELLEACKKALYALKGREYDQYLRDAIAKAEGRQA
jgi:hypothetical protein